MFSAENSLKKILTDWLCVRSGVENYSATCAHNCLYNGIHDSPNAITIDQNAINSFDNSSPKKNILKFIVIKTGGLDQRYFGWGMAR